MFLINFVGKIVALLEVVRQLLNLMKIALTHVKVSVE